MSDELRMVKAMEKALDSNSFDLNHAAAMLASRHIFIQKRAFNLFMKMVHYWATTDVSENHPMFNVVMLSKRLSETLPVEVS